jgi:hypothetical protein
MTNKSELKRWRAEEIAKILLRKSIYNLNIESFPTQIFDFFITLDKNPKSRFAVEVKTKHLFERSIKQHLSQLITYGSNGMINIPAILIKVDEPNETAELDFLVIPSESGELIVKKEFKFQELTPQTLDSFIKKINQWWNQKGKI